MTVSLKHSKVVRVKPLAATRVKTKTAVIRQAKYAVKPLPVRKSNSRVIKAPRVVRSNARPVKVVTQPRLTRIERRTIRQLPNTRLRLRSSKPIVRSSSVRTGLSAAEGIGRIKNIGRGKALIIVGNGPSHREAPLPELVGCSQIDFMSINKPDDRIWPTEYWLFCDNSQQRRHKPLWMTYNGTMINSSAIRGGKANAVQVKSLHGKGFSLNITKGMHIGRSSVYAALQVGLWMDYDRIYVFGCDMAAVGGKLYPWGSNPDVTDKARMKRFKYEAEHFGWMAKNVPNNVRKKIAFCTKYNPWGFIKQFEQLDHMDAIDIIKNRHAAKNKNVS